ncbi:hypothetical protein L873DRAFT_1787494 [Choiromyces venosus 120613-1]|uniref:Uncharacterized protein n=1 Tax=Choiromyces venosus 120613-1 TaxID=1336337 RepID=A0A3N4JX89_9PEZI|nr:hypothetical protein L873DRAFT_1787494 [Choiromyces venosus 120613-1]
MPRKQATTGKVDERNQKLGSTVERRDDSATCDARMATRSQISQIGSEGEVNRDAKDALEQALHEEELDIENAMGETFFSIRRGRGLIGLPARVDAVGKEIASLKIRVTSLEDRMGGLTSSLEAYKRLRNRFISAFKIDKGLVNATEEDRKIITEGNGWAQGGDVVVDAQLYQDIGGRRDGSAFEKLYGIMPGDIRAISSGYQPTIDALNFHAGVIASKDKIGSDEFYARFSEFMKLFEEFDYDDGYLEGHATDLTRAYWSFLNCIKNEVKWVDAVEASD